ncbi:tetratricopeptide repeat protein [candidate division KSB1 bacterium]|nr:tetratricopeptide repeat protein [candidate division KSB1 bacterium]
MTPLKKIIGTSIFSLLLAVVGLFMVCSGRVQQVELEDDLFAQDASDEAYKDDLLKRLEVLEGETGAQETAGAGSTDAAFTGSVNDPLATNDAESTDAAFAGAVNPPQGTNDAESFLTPELFQGMNAEVNQLEMLAANKDQAIDSLRAELEEKNYQSAAMQTAAGTRKITGKPLPSVDNAAMYKSEFGQAYQDALDDFYVRRFDSAVRKFQALLQSNDKNELADNCQYWIGECYYAMGRYYEAIAEFQKVYVFAKSNKTPDAQLMIGLAFLKNGEKDMARAELNIVLSFDPRSASAKKAQRYLRMIDNA